MSGGVRYGLLSVWVEVSGMVTSMYGWRCQVWSVQCMSGGVRYGEFSVRVEVSGMISSVYGWRCQYGQFSV